MEGRGGVGRGGRREERERSRVEITYEQEELGPCSVCLHHV